MSFCSKCKSGTNGGVGTGGEVMVSSTVIEVKRDCRISAEVMSSFKQSNNENALFNRVIELLDRNNKIEELSKSNQGEGNLRAYLKEVEDLATRNRYELRELIERWGYKGHMLKSGESMRDAGYRFRIASLAGVLMVGVVQCIYFYKELVSFNFWSILDMIPGVGLPMVGVIAARYWYLSPLELVFRKEVDEEVERQKGGVLEDLKKGENGEMEMSFIESLGEVGKEIDVLKKKIEGLKGFRCGEDGFERLFELLVGWPIGFFIVNILLQKVLEVVEWLERRNYCAWEGDWERSWGCILLSDVRYGMYSVCSFIIIVVLLCYYGSVVGQLYIEVREWLDKKRKDKKE